MQTCGAKHYLPKTVIAFRVSDGSGDGRKSLPSALIPSMFQSFRQSSAHRKTGVRQWRTDGPVTVTLLNTNIWSMWVVSLVGDPLPVFFFFLPFSVLFLIPYGFINYPGWVKRFHPLCLDPFSFNFSPVFPSCFFSWRWWAPTPQWRDWLMA